MVVMILPTMLAAVKVSVKEGLMFMGVAAMPMIMMIDRTLNPKP